MMFLSDVLTRREALDAGRVQLDFLEIFGDGSAVVDE